MDNMKAKLETLPLSELREIARSMGLDRSRLNMPMMDFASMTYLPEIRSKSLSNWHNHYFV